METIVTRTRTGRMERVVLQHLDGSRSGTSEAFTLSAGGTLLLGRDPLAQVRFDVARDRLVGRRHACIALEALPPCPCTLTDLDSQHGTFVNRVRIVGQTVLRMGDIIQLGAGGPRLVFAIAPGATSAHGSA